MGPPSPWALPTTHLNKEVATSISDLECLGVTGAGLQGRCFKGHLEEFSAEAPLHEEIPHLKCWHLHPWVQSTANSRTLCVHGVENNRGSATKKFWW